MKICIQCVMDETDPEISFNLLGQCNHCVKAIENYATLRQNLPNLSQQLDRNLSIFIYYSKIRGHRHYFRAVLHTSR